MADEDIATVPDGEVATTEPAEHDGAEAGAEETTEAVADADAESEGEGDEHPPEEHEFDFGGNKLRVRKDQVPEELAAEIAKFTKGTWSDYTRRSKDVAERAKSLETREKVVETLQTLNGEALETYSRGLAMRQEIEQLSKIDLNALWQSDPDQARRVSDAISQKQAELSQIVHRVGALETKAQTEQQAEIARRRDEGAREVEKRIPEFAKKHLNDVAEYMVARGLPKEEVANWPLNPIYVETAFKAMMWDRMQAKAKQAAKPKPAQAQPVRPMQGKGGGAAKDIAHMSAAEMAKHLGLPG